MNAYVTHNCMSGGETCGPRKPKRPKFEAEGRQQETGSWIGDCEGHFPPAQGFKESVLGSVVSAPTDGVRDGAPTANAFWTH